MNNSLLDDQKRIFNSQSSSNLQNLSDQNLYSLCRTYGARALEWRQKFIGLLPEVFKRKLYERKGFESIFVFAKKLAGLSEEQVRRVLNLEERFESVPMLRDLLVNGEVSVNKLARVASIASVENQEFLATQVRILSKSAVETFVRDEKFAGRMSSLFGNIVDNSENQNGFFEPKIEDESVPGHTLDLSPEVHQKLLALQQKGLDLNQILLKFLEKREEEIVQKKEQITEETLRKEKEKASKAAIIQGYSSKSVQSRGRYIPRAVKKILYDEHGTKCSIRNCQKSATTIHHTQRFSLSGSHDPHYLAPLCREHHEIAHAVDVRCQKMRNR